MRGIEVRKVPETGPGFYAQIKKAIDKGTEHQIVGLLHRFGPVYDGITACFGDQPATTPENVIVSAACRFACDMPVPKRDVSAEFEEYAKHFIRRIKGVHPEDVPTFTKWVSETSYSGSRKESLTQMREDLTHITKSFYKCKSFIKWQLFP